MEIHTNGDHLQNLNENIHVQKLFHLICSFTNYFELNIELMVAFLHVMNIINKLNPHCVIDDEPLETGIK